MPTDPPDTDLFGERREQPNPKPRKSKYDDLAEMLRRYIADSRGEGSLSRTENTPSPPAQAPPSQSSQLAIFISLLAAVLSGTVIQALARLVPGQNWLVNPDLLTIISVLIAPLCAPRQNRLSVAVLVGTVLLILASAGWALWISRSPSIDAMLQLERPPSVHQPSAPSDDAVTVERKVLACERSKLAAIGRARTNVANAKGALTVCHAKPQTLSQWLSPTPRCKDEGESLIQAERELWFAQRRDCSLPAAK